MPVNTRRLNVAPSIATAKGPATLYKPMMPWQMKLPKNAPIGPKTHRASGVMTRKVPNGTRMTFNTSGEIFSKNFST